MHFQWFPQEHVVPQEAIVSLSPFRYIAIESDWCWPPPPDIQKDPGPSSSHVVIEYDLQDADVRKRKHDIVVQLAITLGRTLPPVHAEAILKQSVQHIRVDPDPRKLYAKDPPMKVCKAVQSKKLSRPPSQSRAYQKHKYKGR